VISSEPSRCRQVGKLLFKPVKRFAVGGEWKRLDGTVRNIAALAA